jgi:hypothetical protein
MKETDMDKDRLIYAGGISYSTLLALRDMLLRRDYESTARLVHQAISKIEAIIGIEEKLNDKKD